MATVVNATVITGSNSGTIPSTTAGNTLFVAYGGSAGQGSTGTCSVSGITLGGTSLTREAYQDDAAAASASCSEIWMLTGIAGGQTAVAVSGTGLTAADAYILAVEVSGMGAAMLDVTSSGPLKAGTQTFTSNATGVLAGSGEFAIGVTSHGPNAGTGDTLAVTSSGWTGAAGFTWTGGSDIGGYLVTTSASAVTFSGTSVDYDYYTCVVAVFKPGVFSGAAAFSGTGTLGAMGVFAGSAALAGTGSLTATGVAALEYSAALSGTGLLGLAPTGGGGSAALSGQGSLGGTSLITMYQAALSGQGSLAALGGATYKYAAALSGVGLLSAGMEEAWLSGAGYMGITGLGLGYVAGLSGVGTLSIPGTLGGLVAGVGGAAVPQAMPGSSQVAVAPPGSSNWQYLGTLGQVTALTYGYVCPGGCDSLSMTIMCPASYRTQLFNPGWQVRVYRGGHQVWDGVLDEPQPLAGQGWTLTAVGTGNLGTNYVSFYAIGDTWPTGEPDEVVNRAITRGLPWYNPGLNSSPYASQFWLGQETDPASQTVTAILNLICTRGGLTWYVNSQPGGQYGTDDLTVFPLPTTPTRLLVCTTPVARTLGGDINTIYIRYMVSADNTATGAAAAYAMTYAQNAQSVAAHGELETYIDLSDVGVMTATAAAAIGNSVLQVYQRASFAGPFTASYGQLLTMGGQAIDPGTEQAGSVVQLILTDFGYGGEVTPQFPISFVVGSYVWDDFAQVATITPYQNLDQSLTGLLSMESTVLTPITAAS